MGARFERLERKDRPFELVRPDVGQCERSGDAEYPYPTVIPVDRFDAVARRLALCRQERRIVYGRIIGYSLREVAIRLGLAQSTVKHYDRSARERTGADDGGQLIRLVVSQLFVDSPRCK